MYLLKLVYETCRRVITALLESGLLFVTGVTFDPHPFDAFLSDPAGPACLLHAIFFEEFYLLHLTALCAHRFALAALAPVDSLV